MIRAIHQWLKRRARRAALTSIAPARDPRCSLTYFRRANGAK